MKLANNSHSYITIGIALVWLINGLYAKILNGVPRHEEIVAVIIGEEYSSLFINLIGFSEIGMCLWVLSRKFYRFNAIVQICIIILMNIIETLCCSKLLLWGNWNIVFAILFSILIYWNNFKNDEV